MHVTSAMVMAARRAEFDFYQKRRWIGAERFVPTSDAVIKGMPAAALKRSSQRMNQTLELVR
jgi:hypothetical protein